MDTRQTKQLVMQAYQFYKDNNIKGILGLNDDQIEWVGPESESVPFAGSFHGNDQVAQFFSKLDQCQEVVQFEPHNFIAEGDKVAVTGNARWRVKASGQTYDSAWVHIFTLRDNKIVRFEQHSDTAAAEAAYRSSQPAGMTQDAAMRH